MKRWGSYTIRCRHFKSYAERFFGPQVQVDTNPYTTAKGHYNATILTKVLQPNDQPNEPSMQNLVEHSKNTLSFGQIFIDLIDFYPNPEDIPDKYHLIVQNELHAQHFKNSDGQRWKSSNVHIVPHWFNAFPGDAKADTPALPPLVLANSTTTGAPLQLAMVWSARGPGKQHANETILLPEEGYEFHHINLAMGIATYLQESTGSSFVNNHLGQKESIQAIAQDPSRQDPYLFMLLFRQFDVLLVLGKTDGPKLYFNSAHRAVSQMRSGVPIVLECTPSQQHLCLEYPCHFDTGNSTQLKAVLERMKNVSVRQDCVDKGIEITKKYTPKRVIDDYLTIIGLPPEKRWTPPSSRVNSSSSS
eukprot:CAMPEP_0172448396 /NCGR_PEP_ID=MMETSP1065-20121228/7421_1 /TAXON_ID=265537 /ORGANISM="Amphiprora paludosa, Strain CCMP125" /LENGTH=359 /DNA_ID=CAMNT_0013199875 /DNA_START=120 /DNA_END=1199 /DNA_ORIENTATION=+